MVLPRQLVVLIGTCGVHWTDSYLEAFLMLVNRRNYRDWSKEHQRQDSERQGLRISAIIYTKRCTAFGTVSGCRTNGDLLVVCMRYRSGFYKYIKLGVS